MKYLKSNKPGWLTPLTYDEISNTDAPPWSNLLLHHDVFKIAEETFNESIHAPLNVGWTKLHEYSPLIRLSTYLEDFDLPWEQRHFYLKNDVPDFERVMEFTMLLTNWDFNYSLNSDVVTSWPSYHETLKYETAPPTMFTSEIDKLMDVNNKSKSYNVTYNTFGSYYGYNINKPSDVHFEKISETVARGYSSISLADPRNDVFYRGFRLIDYTLEPHPVWTRMYGQVVFSCKIKVGINLKLIKEWATARRLTRFAVRIGPESYTRTKNEPRRSYYFVENTQADGTINYGIPTRNKIIARDVLVFWSNESGYR